MTALIVSAQFAAYTWFTAQRANAAKSRATAMRFARAHWEDFLPLANEGVGRLLLRIADVPRRRLRRHRLAQAAFAETCAPFSLN